MGGRHIKWNLHGRSAYTPKLFAQFLPQLTAPTSSYMPVDVWTKESILFQTDSFKHFESQEKESDHLTSEGAPGVTLASVDSKTWTSGTKHTWLYVALVDEPGEGNLVEKGDYSHSLSTQSAFVTMGSRSWSSCRVSG